MALVLTMLVMGQHIYDPAFCNAPFGTGLDHGFHFCLESRQSLNPTDDRLKVFSRQHIDFLARPLWLLGEGEQLTDRSDFKAQLPRMSNEFEAPDSTLIIASAVRRGAWRLG